MLEFSDFDSFLETMEYLDKNTIDYIKSFNEKYPGLNDVEYNNLIESLGFDEEYILNSFESTYGFNSSMRKHYNNLVIKWLDNDSLIQDNDPIYKYPFSSIEMTLLNEYGEVKIGEGIFKILDNGYIYITDGDYETLSKFNQGDNSVLTQSNVTSNFNDIFTCLIIASETPPYKSFDGNKKARMHEHFHTYVLDVVSNTNLTIYRKNDSNGHWKKWSMPMTVGNTTYFFDNDCEYIDGMISDDETANTSSLSNHCYDFNLTNVQWKRAKNNSSVCGSYTWPNKYEEDILSW
jgi:hypothetical protein